MICDLILKLSLTPGIVHCRRIALSKVCSSNVIWCTRKGEHPNPGNEPYPKTLAFIEMTIY